MKRVFPILSFGAVLVLAVTACGKDGKEQKSDETTAAKPAAGDQTAAKKAPAESQSLKTYENSEYGFAVEAPQSPKVAQTPAPSEAGQLMLNTFNFAPPGTQGGLVISVSPIPKDREINLDGARDGAISTMGATLVSSEDVKLGEHPGRAFRFRVPSQNITGYVRLFAREHMLYQVLMAHMDSDKKLAETGRQFVDSFRFFERTN